MFQRQFYKIVWTVYDLCFSDNFMKFVLAVYHLCLARFTQFVWTVFHLCFSDKFIKLYELCIICVCKIFVKISTICVFCICVPAVVEFYSKWNFFYSICVSSAFIFIGTSYFFVWSVFHLCFICVYCGCVYC